MIVSFRDFEPPPRYDGLPWTQVQIRESATLAGTYALLETQTLTPVDHDPENPIERNFTTKLATLTNGWYKIVFVDAAALQQPTEPIYNGTSTQILASLDDINAEVDGVVIEADPNNTSLIQVSVARVIRAFLAPIVDRTVLYSWVSPSTTPEIIRTIAGKLIAAQLYMSKIAAQSSDIPNTHIAQRLYNEAMALLNMVISGEIIIDNVVVVTEGSLTLADFFPVDAKDRAFSMGMEV